MGMELYKSFESLFLSHFKKVGIFRCQWYGPSSLGKCVLALCFGFNRTLKDMNQGQFARSRWFFHCFFFFTCLLFWCWQVYQRRCLERICEISRMLVLVREILELTIIANSFVYYVDRNKVLHKYFTSWVLVGFMSHQFLFFHDVRCEKTPQKVLSLKSFSNCSEQRRCNRQAALVGCRVKLVVVISYFP